MKIFIYISGPNYNFVIINHSKCDTLSLEIILCFFDFISVHIKYDIKLPELLNLSNETNFSPSGENVGCAIKKGINII